MYSSINSKIDMTKISQLVAKLGYLLTTCNLTIDSRQVNGQSIFCAYPGVATDGRKFVSAAKQQGAQCIIEEGEFNLSHDNHYYIENLQQVVGILASFKHHVTENAPTIIGVTGTNGKTSITQWLGQIGTIINKNVGVVGTLGSGIYPHLQDNAATTPSPVILHDLLNSFQHQQVQLVAMEVSSHGIYFDCAVFTNLTQDHLDYHQTMENYYLAKKQLFFWQGLHCGVINIDDDYGYRLHQELTSANSALSLITYAINKAADVTANNIKITVGGSQFSLCYGAAQVNITLATVGVFNIYNVLALSGVLLHLGYKLADLPPLLAQVRPVKGRMETIMHSAKPLVVVDYAHTPDALEKVLINLRQIEHSGKLYCVFGCGGNRDSAKRPLMGKIAIEHADYTIITTDNPRHENPQQIIEQIVAGISGNTNKYTIQVNRAQAIKQVLTMAQANDIVLIAGKGHEEYQEIAGVREYFSDSALAQEILTSAKGNEV